VIEDTLTGQRGEVTLTTVDNVLQNLNRDGNRYIEVPLRDLR